MKRIHIIYTGGTIGSQKNDSGTIDLIGTSNEPKTNDGYVITSSSCFQILSENMNPKYWSLLLKHIKEINFADIDGLLITHGTDTLAFTANLFALLLHGTNIPVFFISAHKPLEDPESNGHDNMNAAIDFVLNMKSTDQQSGVFVPYKNIDGKLSIHKAEKIMQSGDFSNDFYSVEGNSVNNLDLILQKLKEQMLTTNAEKARAISFEEPLYKSISNISGEILAIRPYPGINYDCFDITKPDAVLHGTYHSQTATDEKSGSGSLTRFAARAVDCGKQVYLAPVSSDANKIYVTLENLKKNEHISPLYDMSFEMAYAYLCLLY